jgi:hypothetical protein
MLQVAFRLAFCACLLGLVVRGSDDTSSARHHSAEYMHEWAARVSDPLEADLIAAETGFINRGPIAPFHDIYLFENANVPRRSKRHAQTHTERLQGHEKVLWAEQQVSKLRTKRDHQNVETVLKFDKRAEASAYKSTHYDDPQWDDQWYLVSQIIARIN